MLETILASTIGSILAVLIIWFMRRPVLKATSAIFMQVIWIPRQVIWIPRLRRMAAAGLSNFYASRADYARYRSAPTVYNYLDLATETIHVAGYWMGQGTEMEGIAERLVQLVKPPRKLKISIAIIDPTTPYLGSIAQYLNMPRQELRMRLQSSLYTFHIAREQLGMEEKQRFELKVYRALPVASVIILDGDTRRGRVQIDIKPYKVPRDRSFGLELRGNSQPLYRLCRDAWRQLINDAQSFDADVHLVGYDPTVEG